MGFRRTCGGDRAPRGEHREAARRLGLGPKGCVVFEDSDLGMEAASRAGMLLNLGKPLP